MKKLVLLVCVFVLLIVATGAVSANKPEPDQFTITGYTTNDPFTDPETVIKPNGHMRLHVTARGGGDADVTSDGLCASLAEDLDIPDITTCQALCVASQNQACGVAGLVNGKPFTGEFTFDEWVELRMNPLTGAIYGKVKNNGIVTITTVTPDASTVVQFKGEADSLNVWGKFKVEKKTGTGAASGLKGQGDYAGNAGLVFSVTFTGKLND